MRTSGNAVSKLPEEARARMDVYDYLIDIRVRGYEKVEGTLLMRKIVEEYSDRLTAEDHDYYITKVKCQDRSVNLRFQGGPPDQFRRENMLDLRVKAEIIVFDRRKQHTFDKAKLAIQTIRQEKESAYRGKGKDLPIVLIGNKSHLYSDSNVEIDDTEIATLVEENNLLPYAEVSAERGTNINAVLKELVPATLLPIVESEAAKVKLGQWRAALDRYKEERAARSANNYVRLFGVLSRPFGAYGKQEKFDAIDDLIAVLDTHSRGDKSASLGIEHLGPLQQGDLGKLIEDLNINLNSLVSTSAAIRAEA